MLYQFVAMPVRDGPLQFFNIRVDKLGHLAGFKTNHVIVMRALVQFVNRMTALEIMPGHETGGLELRQDPIHGCKADLLAASF